MWCLAELLRFSSASHLLKFIPEETQKVHRRDKTVMPAPITMQPTNHRAALVRRHQIHQTPNPLLKSTSTGGGSSNSNSNPKNIWDGWGDGLKGPQDPAAESGDDDDMDLDGLGI